MYHQGVAAGDVPPLLLLLHLLPLVQHTTGGGVRLPSSFCLSLSLSLYLYLSLSLCLYLSLPWRLLTPTTTNIKDSNTTYNPQRQP